MPHVALITALAVFATPLLAAAQAYEGDACTAKGSHPLKGLKVGASVGTIDDSGTGTYSDWASSTLLPKGKPPVCKDCPPEAEDDLQERTQFLHEWTCTYSAQRVSDGKPETAWCEGAQGPGVGEVLIARVEPGRPVKIWAGFGKSPQLHAANARPRKLLVSVLETRNLGFHQSGTAYASPKVVARGEAELEDINGYQELKLPAFTPDPEAKATFVALEVVSVYPGKKYEDLCISELRSSEP